MHILFITTAHNSLSQRLYVELTELGQTVSIALATSDDAMLEAVETTRPDLILAPMLKKAIPEQIWREHTCVIVHPGIKGDRGPSSLDWAITLGEKTWGVTNLQADAEMDAGPIWASHNFPMHARPYPKSSLYRHEVTEAAVRGALDAVRRFAAGEFRPEPLDYSRADIRGELRPTMKQQDRAINWGRDTTLEIARKIRAADSSPGVLDTLFGEPYYLFGAHEEDRLKGAPKEILATRHGAICLGTVDGALWISHLKPKQDGAIKLPATQVLGERIKRVPHSPLAFDAVADYRSLREIRYVERNAVGYLYFDFYNGAMNTEQCQRLREAYLAARARPTKVIALMGGRDFFSNGINLNAIEAAMSPADESWRNIVAIDDLVFEILNTMSHLTVAAVRGNAGAGGAIMALAADKVYARSGVVLNPHYKGMGGLYGSEYWTYTLPRRVGQDIAEGLTDGCKPLGTRTAKQIGFIDDAFGADVADFEAEAMTRARALAQNPNFWNMLKAKHEQRLADERKKPLAAYRQEELAQMRINFYGKDASYHDARRRFVYKGALPAQTRTRVAASPLKQALVGSM
jgi:putative two-component system protein, hydrogenase maturation factor HypX/HoxX